MSELLRNVLYASFSGSIVIAAVCLLRLALKKVPKKYVCLLWGLALLRLLVPFSIESSLSLQPDVARLGQSQTVNAGTMKIEPVPAVPADAAMPEDVEVEYGDAFASVPEATVSVIEYDVIAAWIWLAGLTAMALYGLISYLRLKRQVRDAAVISPKVRECDRIDTAFILGYLRPRIYLPVGISGKNRGFILAHERAHLKRGDHLVKLVGFIALAVHWFNPLVWAAYILLCKDIEIACDEQVVRDMDLEERKAYSVALVSCSTNHHFAAACPVAFGEVSVKQRIMSVLNYRKKSFWLSLIAIVAVAFVAVCFLTSPAEEEQDLSFLNYQNAISLAAEQDVLVAVHYTAEGEEDSIGIGMAEGKTLAEYLDSAGWTEKWFEPSDISSPGSVAFNISDDLRITVYDRRFAAVKYGDDVRYYRIGREDYQSAVDMLLPVDEKRLEQSSRQNLDLFLEMAGTEDQNAPDWGFSLTASNPTHIGVTLVYQRSGGAYPGSLEFGRYYWLERLTENGWEAVETIRDDIAWFTDAQVIEGEFNFARTIDWQQIYGSLPGGIYRLGKTVSGKNTDGKQIDYNYYAVFEIPDTPYYTFTDSVPTEEELLQQCREALEAFQSLECYSVVCDNEYHVYDVLNNYVMQQFWYDGENWLRIADIKEAQQTDYTLYWDGKLYSRGENGYYPEEESVWEEIPDANAQAYIPWLSSYVWNEEKTSIAAYSDENGLGITLLVEEQITMAGLTVQQYYLDFDFNEDDALTAVSLRLISDVEDVTRDPVRETVSMTVYMGSFDREEISGAIEEYWQN